MAINANLMSQFQDVKPVNSSLIRVIVPLESSSLEEEQSVALLAELQRMAPYSGYSAIQDLEAGDIYKYLSTLKWLRVCTVNCNTDKSFREYKPLLKRLAVPVLEYQVLVSIGLAIDKEFNIEFTPEYTVNQDDLLGVDAMNAISSLFRQFEDSGLKIVYGIPTATEGELDFMAMSHVNAVVCSYRKSHPVYGFLAAFCRQQTLNQTTGSMSRVVYGYEDDYRFQIRALMRVINGVTNDGKA